ncbi:hypothetical protein B7463_g4473, partial [Scytalidium lignicola]
MAPQSHPQAQFVPIAPDLDIHNLVENCSNFEYVTRISVEMLREQSVQNLEKLVYQHVILEGKPLVVEGWQASLHPDLFSATWLQHQYSKKVEAVRDIRNEVNIEMTTGHYLKSMDTLTKQFLSDYRDPKRQLLYLKDIDTPPEWEQYLKDLLPDFLFYLNDCVEPRTGGNGAIRELNEYGQWQFGKGVAPAGDLMSSLPDAMRAQNMMCYIGHEGTHTAAHREMCASLGQNIMVEASQNGKNSKEGSSIWFMTETKDRALVSEFFLSILGHDIEIEKHFAQVNAWKKAPFNIYVVEQRVGDLILIPPLAPHQVWNRGTRTMKVAWNRTCIDTLELAIHEALPRGRMVCRDEQYKNKAIIYYTLLKYYQLLQRETVETKMWTYGRIRQLLEEFKRLFALYTEILVGESFSPTLPEEDVEFLPYDSFVTCSYCRCNIFNRFLTCKGCVLTSPDGEVEAYDVCMDCYTMGRSCACISKLKWVEQWEWHTLAFYHEQWRQVVIQYDNLCQLQETPPMPLRIARKESAKKSIAQICQEQLRLRPWHDPNKPPEPTIELLEDELDNEETPKQKKKRRMASIKNKTHSCHTCRHQELNWKLAFCTTCARAYCYGVLWRAFDFMPQDVMADRNWKCPRCLNICSCGACRKIQSQTPYVPKGTLLGHDTIKFADFRSVESLVDFSKTNLNWLREDGGNDPKQSNRMLRLQEKANAQKAHEADVESTDFNGLLSSQLLADIDDAIFGSGNMLAIDPLLQESEIPIAPLTNGGSHENLSQAISSDASLSIINHTAMDEVHNPHPESNFHTVPDLDDSYAADYGDQWRRNGTDINYAPVANMYSAEIAQPKSLPPQVEHGIGIGYYNQMRGADMILYEFTNLDAAANDTIIVQPAVVGDVTIPASTPTAKKRKRADSDEQDEYSSRNRGHDEAILSQEPRTVSRTLRERKPHANNHDTLSLFSTDIESEIDVTSEMTNKPSNGYDGGPLPQAANLKTRHAAGSGTPLQNDPTNKKSGQVELPAPTETPKRRGRPPKRRDTDGVPSIDSSARKDSELNGSRRSSRLENRVEPETPARHRSARIASIIMDHKNDSTSVGRSLRGRAPASDDKQRRSDDTSRVDQRRTRSLDVKRRRGRPPLQHRNVIQVKERMKQTVRRGRKAHPSTGLRPLIAAELPKQKEKSAMQNKTEETRVSKPLVNLGEDKDTQLLGNSDSETPRLSSPTVAGTFVDTGREPAYDSLFGDDDSSSDGSIPARVNK